MLGHDLDGDEGDKQREYDESINSMWQAKEEQDPALSHQPTAEHLYLTQQRSNDLAPTQKK